MRGAWVQVWPASCRVAVGGTRRTTAVCRPSPAGTGIATLRLVEDNHDAMSRGEPRNFDIHFLCAGFPAWLAKLSKS